VSERDALWRLVNGYRETQAVHVAVTLGVPDLLADGPRSSEELAAATDSHEPSLYRLLRALAALRLLHEEEGHRFSLTPLGAPLRSDDPESLAGWVAFVGRGYHWNAWGQLLHSVRTGTDAMHHTLGQSSWDYRAEHPDEAAIFDRAMTTLTLRSIRDVASSYDFSPFGTLVDVGGGHGALLATLLTQLPRAQGVLFDQPQVVAGARGLLDDAGVSDRCTIVAGSFFDSVPAGGDAYILKSIVHDWDDREAIGILQTCRAAMGSSARLLLIERDLGEANEAPSAKFSDLNMLVALGGRERTQAEYGALFDASGLAFVDETPTPSGYSVFAAAPA
jgi:O-methyltransferase domain/Dimerisation domain